MSNHINLDSKDLPLAAAAWQTPNIIFAVVTAALAGFTFLIVFGTAALHLSQKSPIFNRNAELRNQYYKKCLLHFVERGIPASSQQAHLNCTVNADAYRAQLDSRSR
jgi:hypothetical protein